jgi:hypothetical protein
MPFWEEAHSYSAENFVAEIISSSIFAQPLRELGWLVKWKRPLVLNDIVMIFLVLEDA